MSAGTPSKLILPLLLFLACAAFLPAAGIGERRELTVALYQYEVDEELYITPGAFERKAEQVLAMAEEAGADLLVLPEYLNVLLAFSPMGEIVEQVDTVEEGLELLSLERGRPVGLHELFMEQSAFVRGKMDRVWGAGARRTGMAVLAGTYFAADGGGLVNRAVLYAPDGTAAYIQDKLRLTPFEKQIIGLEPGSAADAELIELDGFQVGLSICRDTFFDDLRTLMKEADIWIDLKANGQAFDRENALLFRRALPARQSEYRFPWGITVCLNGSFLDLFWEGPSEVSSFSERREQVVTVEKAERHDDEELIVIKLN